jgi:hypothetical protein
VKLLRAGRSYVEVGTPISPRVAGRTKAFTLKNAIEVGRTVLRLRREVRAG